MDKFEEHIKKVRQDLDIYNPPPELWNRIEKRLNKEKSIKFKWLAAAAIVIAVLGFAALLFKPSYNQNNNNVTSNAEGINPVTSQLSETEIYYNNLISAIYREAAPLLTTNPEINKELTEDLSRLDSIGSDIRKDLKDNIANQEVVEALIQNYRIKIRLLEDILNLLKENDDNPGKKEKYEL
jgi:predicted PurR-regulated permease PerM